MVVVLPHQAIQYYYVVYRMLYYDVFLKMPDICLDFQSLPDRWGGRGGGGGDCALQSHDGCLAFVLDHLGFS